MAEEVASRPVCAPSCDGSHSKTERESQSVFSTAIDVDDSGDFVQIATHDASGSGTTARSVGPGL
jgi:hypothetical protein